jgi:GT2 family glycosyltransferase
MFHDPSNPITDKWIIWFDDDTIANRDDRWFHKLGHKIIADYPGGARMFGDLVFWTFNPTQLAWVASRPWYRGRKFQMKNQRESPNGNKVFFAAGGFWALSTDAMRAADIPDTELGHNGGDYMLGEQIWQAGFKTANWNRGKRFVFTSSVKRRGLKELHTGMPGWVPGGVAKPHRIRV